jgi:hypothetical protein
MSGYDDRDRDRDRDYDRDDRDRDRDRDRGRDRDDYAGGGDRDFEEAKQKVQLPAIFLMVGGGISIATNLVMALINVFQFMSLSQMGGRAAEEAMPFVLGGMCSWLIGIIVYALQIFGGFKMKNLQSYGLCMTACILAMLPCSYCCILDLGVGIWGLVMLNDTQVKAAMR